jgi:hypothetical protein
MARAAIEAKLLTKTDAGIKVEESAMAEKQARENFEEKLKAETEARLKADAQIDAISRDLAEVKAKLKEAEEARMEAETRAVKEAEVKGQLEQRLQAETEAKAKAESQAKAEAIAKKKYQSQAESEASTRTRVEQELEAVKSRIRNAETEASTRRPVDLVKGLTRLIFILSFVAAGVGGYIAYINGYVINSHYDRPMRLPMFSKPVYLPVNLIAISIGSFIAAWAVYLIVLFVIKGFSRSSAAKIKMITRSEPMVEETVSAGEGRMWRSS